MPFGWGASASARNNPPMFIPIRGTIHPFASTTRPSGETWSQEKLYVPSLFFCTPHPDALCVVDGVKCIFAVRVAASCTARVLLSFPLICGYKKYTPTTVSTTTRASATVKVISIRRRTISHSLCFTYFVWRVSAIFFSLHYYFRHSCVEIKGVRKPH